jgi:uncharacterized protein YbcV (DUF1398 family)
MDDGLELVAARCLRGAEDGTMDFPQIVRVLMGAGFESYAVDFRRGTATYYQADGDSVELAVGRKEGAVAAGFDAGVVQGAIRAAQANGPGYTYAGFCRTVMAAGCAGYIVSFIGQRAVYFGRTGETHVEHFPQ